MEVSVITNKLADVPDSTCRECSQCWLGECRAFEAALCEAEYEHRRSGVMACSGARELRLCARKARIKSGKWTLDSLPGGKQ